MIAFLVLAAVAPEEIADQIIKGSMLEQVVLSADGTHAAWVERAADKNHKEKCAVVWTGAVGEVARAVTPENGNAQAPAFSPDGQTLAFVSAEDKGAAIFTRHGASVKRVADPGGQAQALRFSRDGRRLYFLGAAQTGLVGAVEALPRDSFEVRDQEPEQRLGEIELASGILRWLTPPGYFVYEYDPGPSSFVILGTNGSGLANYWVAELALLDGNGTLQTLWHPPLQLASPKFSPDGKRIAVIHGLMSDQGSNGGDIEVIELASGVHRALLASTPMSVSALQWKDSSTLLFSAYANSETIFAEQKLSDAHERILWRAAEQVDSFDAHSGKAAVIRSDSHTPWHADIGSIGHWQRVSPPAAPLTTFGDATKITWRSDAFEVSGWLLSPKELQPGKKYPLVVHVHGGPGGAKTNGWTRRFPALLASAGYFVFEPNFRGSFGSGEAFTQANRKDFGHGDLNDILVGIDTVLGMAPIDPQKIGICGWSYGGFMAMFAPTQSHRFAASVAGAGISNWQSYAGQNRINTWMLPFYGASVYDAPELYRRSSAIAFIKNTTTPTLLFAGDRDAEVSPAQSYEYWTALRFFKVPTTLVVYPNEGHHFRDLNDVKDVLLRALAWFDRYLR